jgi:hypothetical protein
MRARTALLLVAANCFCTALWAQTVRPSFLGYVHVIQVDVSRNAALDACIIVGADGQYRFEVEPEPGQSLINKTKVYRGYLPVTEFEQFRTMVAAPELRTLNSSHPRGSMLASRSRATVSLRIHRSGETQELVFTTVDGRNPMPPAVHAFIPWMRNLRKALGPPDRHAAPRSCSGLDLTSDFSPELQKR